MLRATAKRDLDEMVKLGLLKLEGAGRSAHYRLTGNRLKNGSPERKTGKWFINGSNGSLTRYQTHNLNERQAKAIEYILQYDSLTIQDYEVLCPEVNRRSLQRDLKIMIEKELIESEGATNQLVYLLRV